MDETITLSRDSVEILATTAREILDNIKPAAPDRLERTEVAVLNNQRNKLKEAVYQAERAIYEADISKQTTEQMSVNAEKLRSWEDSFSEDKINFIEGRR